MRCNARLRGPQGLNDPELPDYLDRPLPLSEDGLVSFCDSGADSDGKYQ